MFFSSFFFFFTHSGKYFKITEWDSDISLKTIVHSLFIHRIRIYHFTRATNCMLISWFVCVFVLFWIVGTCMSFLHWVKSRWCIRWVYRLTKHYSISVIEISLQYYVFYWNSLHNIYYLNQYLAFDRHF